MVRTAQQDRIKANYWLRDHDTDIVNETPPTQNLWYEVFHAQDVRLLWCYLRQGNDETDPKDIEIRWTIDGTIYFDDPALNNGAEYRVYRNWNPSGAGTAGLATNVALLNAVNTVDKRGLDFKVEVRITEAPGTNQYLRCYCVRETLVVT